MLEISWRIHQVVTSPRCRNFGIADTPAPVCSVSFAALRQQHRAAH